MKQVYTFPTEYVVDMRLLQGDEGTFLNPVEDINGNWFVGQEEWNALEFQKFKTMYPAIVALFTLIDYNPKIYKEFV